MFRLDLTTLSITNILPTSAVWKTGEELRLRLGEHVRFEFQPTAKWPFVSICLPV